MQSWQPYLVTLCLCPLSLLCHFVSPPPLSLCKLFERQDQSDPIFFPTLAFGRFIDRRWLFKYGAIFILRWSCFMLRKKNTFHSNNKRNVCLIWNENRQKLDVFRQYPLSIMRKVDNLSLHSGFFSSYSKTNWREKEAHSKSNYLANRVRRTIGSGWCVSELFSFLSERC